MTISTREVTDFTFDQFKNFLQNWYENTKEFDSKFTTSNPENIDGCPFILNKMSMNWPMDNRSILTCSYCIPFEDGSFTFIASSRGNDEIKDKYKTQIGKDVVANNIINYWHIVPFNDGQGMSVTQVSSMHIGGKMNDKIKTRMAGNSLDKCNNFIEQVKKVANK